MMLDIRDGGGCGIELMEGAVCLICVIFATVVLPRSGRGRKDKIGDLARFDYPFSRPFRPDAHAAGLHRTALRPKPVSQWLIHETTSLLKDAECGSGQLTRGLLVAELCNLRPDVISFWRISVAARYKGRR